MIMQRLWTYSLVAAGVLGAQLGACGAAGTGPSITNPMLDRWCDANPCDWHASGDTERVASWHPNDYAVALISDGAAISQTNDTLSSASTDCFSFSMVAKVDRRAHAFLALDFFDNDTNDFDQQLPASDWERRTFLITPPSWFEGVRFSVRKEGPGEVIVAELSAEGERGACKAPPVELLDHRPGGATCDNLEQCASGACVAARCAGCGSDDDCSPGEVCQAARCK